MKTSKLVQLFAILGLGIFLLWGRKFYTKKQLSRPNAYLQKVNKFKKDDIEMIKLSQNGQSIIFEKNNNDWKIASVSADLIKVQDVLNAVFTDSSPSVIAQSQAQREKLDVEGDKAILMELTSSDQTLQIMVGKNVGQSTAVKLQDSNNVYSLRSFPQLNLDTNSWYNLKIVDLDANNIQSLQLKSITSDINLDKTSDDKWQFSDSPDEKVNQDAVNNLLMNLNPLKAEKLLLSSDINDFNQQNLILSLNLQTKDSQNIELRFYPNYNDDNFMVVRNDGQAYVITKYLVENLQKNRSTFILAN